MPTNNREIGMSIAEERAYLFLGEGKSLYGRGRQLMDNGIVCLNVIWWEIYLMRCLNVVKQRAYSNFPSAQPYLE